jgi:hypothetical protein
VSLDAEKVLASTQQPVLRAGDSLKNMVPGQCFLCQVSIVPISVSKDTASCQRNVEVEPAVAVCGHEH